MSSQQATDSPQVKLVHSFVDGYRRGDLDSIANLFHKDLRRIYHPQSIGMPEQTKEEYIPFLAEIFSIWPDGSQPVVHSIIESPGTVIFHLTNKAKTSIGVDMTRESIVILQLVTDEDETLKIKQMEEFTDSKIYLEFFKAVSEAKENRECSASYAA